MSASRLRSLQGDHDCSFVLESFDGSIATLSALVTATGSIPIAEVAFESLELGHTVPIEVLPRRGEPEHAAAFRVRCRFRGVVWEQQEDRPGYCTDLAFRKRVLFAGCEPEDVREDSAAYPLWVTTGPGFEDLRRHLGGR